MAVKIENRGDKPLWVRLNSGASLHLAPRGSSHELPGHEVDDNAQLDKLAQRGTIARITTAQQEAGDKPRARRNDSAA